MAGRLVTSQRLVEDFARWLWIWDVRWEPGATPAETERVPDSYVNEAAVFLAGELGQRLQRPPELDAMITQLEIREGLLDQFADDLSEASAEAIRTQEQLVHSVAEVKQLREELAREKAQVNRLWADTEHLERWCGDCIPRCPECDHWLSRHDPDFGSCDWCGCVNPTLKGSRG